METAAAIYDSIVDKNLLVRRFTVAVTHLVLENESEPAVPQMEQLDLFTDYEAIDKERRAEEGDLERELKIQKALINIRDRYGKNAIVKGLNMKKESTAMERNKQIGGHKA